MREKSESRKLQSYLDSAAHMLPFGVYALSLVADVTITAPCFSSILCLSVFLHSSLIDGFLIVICLSSISVVSVHSPLDCDLLPSYLHLLFCLRYRADSFGVALSLFIHYCCSLPFPLQFSEVPLFVVGFFTEQLTLLTSCLIVKNLSLLLLPRGHSPRCATFLRRSLRTSMVWNQWIYVQSVRWQ